MKRFSITSVIYIILIVILLPRIGRATEPTEPVMPISVEELLEYGLPVVDITTVDGEEPTCVPVYPPEGCLGVGITGAEKIPGCVTVYNVDGSVIYTSGDYEAKTSGMTIKVRGNTSAAYFDKKPFKIKLQKKGDMLGRGDKKYNDKNWVLVKSEDLRFHLAVQASLMMGHEWEPSYIAVNVIMNGDFRGLYILSESVERNEDCRVNIGSDGFILENDAYWWNENGEYLLSTEWNPRFNFTFKYPDYEDTDESQREVMQGIIDRYEDAINDGTYEKVIDVASFANWVLTHDILGTSDGGGVNWYICKNSIYDDSLITCGPIWDFNSAFKLTEMFSGAHRDPFRKYFSHPQMVNFRRAYVARWNEVKDEMQSSIQSLIDDLANTEKWEAYDRSVALNNTRWNTPEDDSRSVYNELKDWPASRFTWLDEAIRNLDVASTIPEKFSLSHSEIDLWVRDEFQIIPDLWPAYSHDPRVYWRTYNSRIATVDQSGNVQGTGVGETDIQAWPVANPSISAKCRVRVHFLKAESISLNESRVSVIIDDEFDLKATVNPSNATDPQVEWLSSDPEVAEVEEGHVKVTGMGKCFIFALTTDGSNCAAWCMVEAATAGLQAVTVTSRANADVYTLDGRLAGRAMTLEEFDSLPAGIYIVEGVKIVKR